MRRVARQLLAPFIVRDPEIVVRVPPFDEAFVAALKLIAPHYDRIEPDEASRVLWEKDQNRSCWIEDEALSPILRAMPVPKNALEIGPGLGRSAIFFSKRYFPSTQFDLFDATGTATKYTLHGQRFDDSFCGNLELLRHCLKFNEVDNCIVVDASLTTGRLPARKYDFIYSFFAVGFHWALDHWLDEILAACHEETLCAFVVPADYVPSARVRALPHRILEASLPLRPVPWATVYYLVFTPKRVGWLNG